MSSRNRMLAALRCQNKDQTPCSFMLFNALKERSEDYLDFIERQLKLGLDAFVQIPPRSPIVENDYYNLHGLPVSYAGSVEIHEWVDRQEGEKAPILVKEYHTPEGVLRTEVRKTGNWRWGNHVPFLDDYLVGRSKKFLIDSRENLKALNYLLIEPSKSEVAEFKMLSQPVIEFAAQQDLLTAGGWGVGADLIGWVYGLDRLVYAIYDTPDFIKELLEIIAAWNRKRMEVVLDYGVDLYIKRAWYENCDFWTPKKYREFIFPILKEDVRSAHHKGALFGYIITSNCMPLLDMIAEAGVDVVIGIDPAHWDFDVALDKLGGKVCMWGGVNGHLTVERGSTAEVRSEVRQAMQTLASSEGFILSPVDNVRQDTQLAFENIEILIDEWKKFSKGSSMGVR